MYIVKAHETFDARKPFDKWTPLHIVLEEKLDALRLSNSLRTVLRDAEFPKSEFIVAIRGFYNLLNEFADIKQKPCTPRTPKRPCGETRCICPYVRLK